jgi:hypothetical protein
MPRWNDFTLVHSVQLEYEDAPKPREIRLCASAARAGDPVRVKLSGVEVEGRITAVVYSVVHGQQYT